MAIKNLCAGILLLLFCIIGFISTSKLESGDHLLFGPSFYPNAIIVLLSLGAFILIYQGINSLRKPAKSVDPHRRNTRGYVVEILLFWLGIALYLTVFHFTGFIVSTLLFLTVAQLLYGRRRYLNVALVSILATGITYFVLVILFEVPLPTIFTN